MKKFLTLVLCLALAIGTLSVFTACNGNNSNTTEKDYGFTYDLVTGATKEDNYLKVTGYNVTDEVAELVSRGNYAADAVKAVSKIEIPATAEYKRNGVVVGTYPVKEIAESAFSNMLFIKEVVIPANVETIGNACLSGLSNLEKLTVDFIGNKKTDNVNSKKTLGYLFGATETTGTTSTTVKYNASGSFTCYVPNALKTVVVTGNQVSEYAFYGLANVQEVVIPNTVTEIGAYAFANCTSLYKIALGDAVTAIGEGAFTGCTSLVNVNLKGVQTIGDSAFSCCNQLFYNVNGTSFVATANLKTVGKNAFKGCTALETVDLSQMTAATVGEYAFSGLTALDKVVLPASGVTYANLVFTGATELKSANVTNYNATLKLFDFDYDI